jgi:hypothetical protein
MNEGPDDLAATSKEAAKPGNACSSKEVKQHRLYDVIRVVSYGNPGSAVRFTDSFKKMVADPSGSLFHGFSTKSLPWDRYGPDHGLKVLFPAKVPDEICVGNGGSSSNSMLEVRNDDPSTIGFH